jgi:histidinol-phosphatase
MQADSKDIARRLEFAVQAARQAGNITLEYFRTEDLVINLKQDDTPVTIADKRAEEHLRDTIAKTFPRDAILGEEFGQQQGSSGYRWILDPIDGTKSFIHGVPLYGTLIGLEYGDESILGVIRIPALDECLYAGKGQGAWYFVGHNPPKPARVSQRKPLAKALFVTSEVISFDQTGRRAVYDCLQSSTRLTRTWGDSYGYLMVATGRADLMVDPVMAIWDAAALLPILEEAGGTFTDWQGRRTILSGEGIATNGLILSEVLEIVKKSG